MPKDKLFSRIETSAVCGSGRKVSSWRSYPQGATRDEYDAIDAAMRKAFGNEGTRTVGTFMDGVTPSI